MNQSTPTTNHTVTREQLGEAIRQWGAELGLSVAFTSPDIPEKNRQALRHWLAQGYHGDMHFFTQNQAQREDPAQLHPGTLSVITARMNYWHEPKHHSLSILTQANLAYISRYALGRDYHKLFRAKLKQLALRIEQAIGPFHWRPFSDSAPIMEHALAEKSGLGFIGKHSLLIHKEAGSTFFLGELLCDLPLIADPPNTHCGCGPCTQCIDICPTKAIVAPFVVDARRCISYLTIEHKGSIDPELRPLMGNRIYGCDDCQLTCPWNKFSQPSTIADFATRHQLNQRPLLELWQWSETDFLTQFEGSPIRRIGYEQWRRNLAIALGNAPSSTTTIEALTQALADASPLVREHIHWALDRQQSPRKLNDIPVFIQRDYL